jgi:hypothetical protein
MLRKFRYSRTEEVFKKWASGILTGNGQRGFRESAKKSAAEIPVKTGQR